MRQDIKTFGHMLHDKLKTIKKIVCIWQVFSNPLYSPDLAPSDYHLLRSMQTQLNTLHLRTWYPNNIIYIIMRHLNQTQSAYYKKVKICLNEIKKKKSCIVLAFKILAVIEPTTKYSNIQLLLLLYQQNKYIHILKERTSHGLANTTQIARKS